MKNVTIAGLLIARLTAAGTQAEKDRVMDEIFARRVARKRAAGDIAEGTANGTLLYADGSGIEMVEEENSDNVRLYECFWVRRDACENGEVQ